MTRSTPPRAALPGPTESGRLIAAHFETTLAALLHGDEVERDGAVLRVRTHEPHPFSNFAVVRDATDVGVIRRAIAPLVEENLPSAVILPIAHDPIDAVATFLAAEGYALDRMPAMGIEVDSLTDDAEFDAPIVERVSDAEGAAQWVDAFEAGYELPRRISELFSPERLPDWARPDASMRFHAIRREGRIVATSMVHLADGVAGVYCVSTIPEARRAGLGARVTAEALRDAGRAGYPIGVLQSSEMGEAVYRRLGFRSFGALPLFVRMPAD